MIVKKVDWEVVKEPLNDTFEGDGDFIRWDVVNGFAQCWQVGDCYLITRREGDELVILCLAGKNLTHVAPIIAAAAKNAGCKTMRYHTYRRGLVKILKAVGFREHEYICKAEL